MKNVGFPRTESSIRAHCTNKSRQKRSSRRLSINSARRRFISVANDVPMEVSPTLFSFPLFWLRIVKAPTTLNCSVPRDRRNESNRFWWQLGMWGPQWRMRTSGYRAHQVAWRAGKVNRPFCSVHTDRKIPHRSRNWLGKFDERYWTIEGQIALQISPPPPRLVPGKVQHTGCARRSALNSRYWHLLVAL